MNESAPGQSTEESLAHVFDIRTRRLLGHTAMPTMTPVEPAPEASLATVINIRNGNPMDQAQYETWVQNGEIALRVFWSRADLPDNVTPLEDGWLDREVKALCTARHNLLAEPYPRSLNTRQRTVKLYHNPSDLL